MNISKSCENNCSNNGVCRNDRCLCFDGYFGDECETKLECENYCSYRGYC